MKNIPLYLAAVAVAMAALWVMNGSYQDEIKFHNDYCEQVKLWEDGERHGVSQYNRKGHPNYKNRDCSNEW